MLKIGLRMFGRDLGDHTFVFEEAFAQAFERVHPCIGRRRETPNVFERGTDGLGIDIAHQAADVLQLAPPRLMLPDTLTRTDRLPQVVGQFEPLQLIGIERDEFRAQRLQLMHRALERALARLIKGVFAGIHG